MDLEIANFAPQGRCLADLIVESRPRALQRQNLLLALVCSVALLGDAVNGYNASLLGGLLQNDDFIAFFGGSNKGAWVTMIVFLYQIGQATATPFIGPCLDSWGRRKGIMVGLYIVMTGVLIQGTTLYTHSSRQLMASRFLLGFGVSLIGCGCSIYVTEMCHPVYRGPITALYNTAW